MNYTTVYTYNRELAKEILLNAMSKNTQILLYKVIDYLKLTKGCNKLDINLSDNSIVPIEYKCDTAWCNPRWCLTNLIIVLLFIGIMGIIIPDIGFMGVLICMVITSGILIYYTSWGKHVDLHIIYNEENRISADQINRYFTSYIDNNYIFCLTLKCQK